LRYWLSPFLASAHLWERASKPLPELLLLSLPNTTIAAAQTRVKGIVYDICVLPHILRGDAAQEVSIAPPLTVQDRPRGRTTAVYYGRLVHAQERPRSTVAWGLWTSAMQGVHPNFREHLFPDVGE
jgi:hypothetical protein